MVDQHLVDELLSVISQWRENDHWQVRLFLIFCSKSQLIFTAHLLQLGTTEIHFGVTELGNDVVMVGFWGFLYIPLHVLSFVKEALRTHKHLQDPFF